MYVMSKDTPEDVWFTWSRLEPHTSSLSTGEKLTKYKIDNSFRRLEEKKIIVHAKRDKDSDRKEGYRLVEMKPYED